MICLFHLIAAPSQEKERAAAIQRLIIYLNTGEKSNAEIKAAISHFRHFEYSGPQGMSVNYAAYDPNSRAPIKSERTAGFSFSPNSTSLESGELSASRHGI